MDDELLSNIRETYLRIKVKGTYIALFHEATSSQKRFMARVVLPATHAFMQKWNKPYMSLPFQPNEVVFIDRPRMDGRLSWPRHHNGE